MTQEHLRVITCSPTYCQYVKTGDLTINTQNPPNSLEYSTELMGWFWFGILGSSGERYWKVWTTKHSSSRVKPNRATEEDSIWFFNTPNGKNDPNNMLWSFINFDAFNEQEKTFSDFQYLAKQLQTKENLENIWWSSYRCVSGLKHKFGFRKSSTRSTDTIFKIGKAAFDILKVCVLSHWFGLKLT